jgi:hypothetical protein
MVKTTLLLEEETALALRELANARGKSQEEIIRDAIAAYAPKISRPLPKGIGAYRSGRSDVSERAEELLREAARERR